MKTRKLRILRSLVALVTLTFVAFTLVCAMQVKAADDGIDYVSFGASNANGYGLRGYLGSDDNYNRPWAKGEFNVYGYRQKVENSYPDLLADMMEEAGYKDVTVVKDFAGLDRVVYGRR